MKKLKWKTRQVAGQKHIEGEDESGKKIFDSEVRSSNIQMYDMRVAGIANARKYIHVFADVKQMKAVCEKSLDDVSVLEDYVDVEFYELSKRATDLIHKTDKFLEDLKKKNGK